MISLWNLVNNALNDTESANKYIGMVFSKAVFPFINGQLEKLGSSMSVSLTNTSTPIDFDFSAMGDVLFDDLSMTMTMKGEARPQNQSVPFPQDDVIPAEVSQDEGDL